MTTLVSAIVIAFTSYGSSNATEINLGGFQGNVSTIVTHGLSVRAESDNCFLVSGNQNTLSSALKSLIGGNPHDGNGGCNFKRVDDYGSTATKVIDVGSVNGDDGRLNFKQGDVIDAGQSISLSFTGTNSSGVSLNLSGIAMVNPILDINKAAFKTITGEGEDHLESDIKLGNAYLSAPISDTVDITLGNYVQSQGATALFPIGVNVVNPVSLPILRSPGAQLKDALLPQAMIGATAYLDGGVTMEAYYQLEQKEVEVDTSGTFFGSDVAGVGNSAGIISSALYNEDPSIPVGGVFFDAAQCIKGLSGAARLGATCNASTAEHLYASNEDTWSIFHDLMNTQFGDDFASGALKTAADAGASGSIDGYFEVIAGVAGTDTAFDQLGTHASGGNSTLTNDQVRAAFNRMYSQYPGRGDMAGLLYIRRGPDAKADNSGQYGLNLSGYADNIGSGVEWGLYFNNSHSNAPRIRMLAIQNGYASDVHSFLIAASSAVGSGGMGQVDHTNGTVTQTESVIAGLSLGQSICGLVVATPGAFANSTHFFDPGKCYAAQVAGGVDAAMQSAAIGAAATLAFANAGRYQLYYPEDIKTMGVSLATGINGWASNFEVAYRPDHPLQIAAGDLVNNLIDSTYGTVIQSISSYATGGGGSLPLAATIATANWSAMPRCDISSATGKASVEMSGYAVCDGTAEFDVWTANANFAKSYTASEPFVVNAGADAASLLIDIGAVSVPDINYNQGVVSAGHFQSGHDVYQNGCKDGAGTGGSVLTPQANGLFGNGYCEGDSGADDLAFSYKLRGALTYNNFNNSKWAFIPSFGFNHDISGNAPSSVGGFVEGRMSASATASFSSGGMSTSLSYQMELGDELNNSSVDKDYVSANFSYAF